MPEGRYGWDGLTAYQQSLILAYRQVKHNDEQEWQISLAGGRSKPGKKK